MATERSVMVRLNATVDRFVAGMKTAEMAVKGVRNEINTTNDRTAWLAQGILALAPTLAPLGAAGVPAVAALATQLGLATGAAATAALAFNGVGDALGALNDYQIDPTSARLKKLNDTMAAIGPEGAEFVRFLDSLGPAYAELANVSRQELFPGLEDGIRTFTDDLLPRLQVIVGETANALGQLASEAGDNLAGPQWEEFFSFLQSEAQPLLEEMGRTVGNLALGFANLLVAFQPMTRDFSSGLLEMSRSFAEWSAQLDSNASFQEFLAYIQEATPRVLALLEALVDMTAALITAAAPVGDLMLPAFTGLFRVIEQIAETPLGPMFIAAAAAASIYGRAFALAESTTGGAMGKITAKTRENTKAAMGARLAWRDFGNTMANVALSQKQLDQRATWGPLGEKSALRARESRDALKQYGKQVGGTAAQLGLLAFAMTDLDDKMGLTSTTMLTLIGSMAGPWGAAAGAAVGFAIDFSKANDQLVESIERADAAARDSDLTRMLEARAKLEGELAEMQGKIGRANFGRAGNPFDYLSAIFNQDDVDDAQRQLDVLNKSIEDAQTRLSSTATTGPRGYGQMFGDIDEEATKAAFALEDFAEGALAVQSILDRSGSLIAYERALDDLTASIKENGNSWDVGTEAGRSNLEARNALVDKAILRAQALKEEGDNLGAQRILDRAIRDLDTFVGESEGARKRAIKPLRDALKDIDKTNAKPKITVNNKQALHAISEVNDAFAALRRTMRLGLQAKIDAQLGDVNYDTGGWTGGGDKRRAAGVVHLEEFVVPAPYARRDRAELERRYLPGYANGGFVGAGSSLARVPGERFDYDRMGAAVAANSRGGALFAGNLNVHGDRSMDRTVKSLVAAKGGV